MLRCAFAMHLWPDAMYICPCVNHALAYNHVKSASEGLVLNQSLGARHGLRTERLRLYTIILCDVCVDAAEFEPYKNANLFTQCIVLGSINPGSRENAYSHPR